MKYKLLYFLISLVLMLPGIYYLATSGLKFGIDFTGGALLEYSFQVGQQQIATDSAQIAESTPSASLSVDDLRKNISDLGVEIGQVVESGDNTYIIKTKPLEQNKINEIKEKLTQVYGNTEERRIENVGPLIGKELQNKALFAIGLATVGIILYIAFSFRKVPKPTASWRFGIAAIFALLHDVLIVVGIFAILGHFWGVEVDTLFVTALLTIIGFSVHDTIVVFDRIRENLLKNVGRKFSDVANISIVQTIGRSLNTSLTVVFVLLALLLFGGETIRWFVVALLIGMVTGTYSSIFNATAFLVWWEERLGH